MKTLIDLEKDGALWNEAKKLYSVGPRVYHTFQHAMDVLERVDRVEADIGFVNPEAARLAALFHDAIYVIGASDNESKSVGEMWRSVYDNLSKPTTKELDECVDQAATLIRATSHHTSHIGFFDAWDIVLFMDCDMKGFADNGLQFRKHNSDIDAEFAMSPGFDAEKYQEGRMKFLFALQHKGIFRSPYFRKRYERLAKANLKEYLEELAAGVTGRD